MPDIKELLISPFSLVPSSPSSPSKKKAHQRPFQPCKCDSDNEDMAPECAFICSLDHHHSSRNRNTKKRKHASPRMKKTKRRTGLLQH